MKQRLVSDPTLQPLLAQYVPLEINVNQPEFAVWTNRYKPSGRGIPMIFIVSSEGEEIYNRSGAPQGDALVELLMRGIQETGGVKTPGAAGPGRQDNPRTTLIAVRRLLARDDPAAAIELLVPAVESQPTGAPAAGVAGGEAAAGSRRRMDPQTQLHQLLEELEETAAGELQGAIGDLATQNTLVGAVRLLRVERLYGGLPAVKPSLAEAFERLLSQPDGQSLIDQARMIDKARRFEERRNTRAAVAAYHDVIAAHPQTRAAQLSQQRVQQLTGEPEASTVQAEATAAEQPAPAELDAPRRWTDRSGQYSVVAALVESDERSVQLRKEDGQIVTVPLATLSDECQQHAGNRGSDSR